ATATGPHRAPPAFPTRRSSDLRSEPSVLVHPGRAARASDAPKPPRRVERDPAQAEIDRVLDKISARGIDSLTPAERRFLAEMSRSEEHTSELQSRSDLVCRLLP